ncbi:MAG: hypothetical protein HXX18_05120 [Bacteroidetes bacterium]|nr:hypothetical protein [Bacteroidota bacterium]
MEEIQHNNQQPIINTPKQRPQMLSFICILTFIWSGIGLLNNLFCVLLYDPIKEYIPVMVFPEIYKEMKPALLQLFSANRFFFITTLVFCFFSLFGAIKMWKLQKLGFHFYTISQILLLMLPLVFIKGGGTQSFEIVITAMFVIMYAMHLKVMN